MTRLASTGCEASLAASYSSKARREERRARERAGPEAANDDETAGTLGRRGEGARKFSEGARQSSQPARAKWRRGRAGRLAGRWPIPNKMEKDSAPKPCLETRRWAVVIGCPVPNA